MSEVKYPCEKCGKDTGLDIWDLCPKCLDMSNYRFRNEQAWKANEDGYEVNYRQEFDEFEDEDSPHYLTPEERSEALRLDW